MRRAMGSCRSRRAASISAAGDVFPLKFKMKAVPHRGGGRCARSRACRILVPKPPRGSARAGGLIDVSQLAVASLHPATRRGQAAVAACPPTSRCSTRSRIAGATISADYHRYPNFEVPYVKGHWYDPFNRNKLKGDYPIIGNQTFLDITFTSDTFADGRRLPVPSGFGSASPGRGAVLRTLRAVLHEREHGVLVQSVSWRHGVVPPAGLAHPDHAGDECQLPGGAGKRRR